uniref:Ig-like domain-containing protein n=2 Tax=Clastoptera arizonana TaxID=38151 RepID=A0A1B6DXL8_9HEMI
MKSSAFWCSLLFGIAIFNLKVVCRPQDLELDYVGDEEEDYENDYDDAPYKGPAPVMKSKNETITAKLGSTVNLPCDVDNSKSFVLMWLNASVPQAPTPMWIDNIRQMSKDERINKLSDNSIEIKDVSSNDAGIYLCKLMSQPELSVYHTLVIEAPLPPGTKPTITSFKPGKEISVKKGSDVFLSCIASGNPAPKITWSKNDNRNNDARIQEDGTSLTIDSVTRKNAGIYTCNAHNSIGSDSKSVTVHVHYAPEIEMDDFYSTNDDEVSINLICTVHATPRAKVTWLKDGKAIPQSQQMVNEKNKYTLHLAKVKPSDFGEYTCEASNKEGHSKESRLISGKPKKPVLQTIKDPLDGKKSGMVWTVQSYSNSPTTEYELMYKTKQEPEWKIQRNNLIDDEKNNRVIDIKHEFESTLPSAEYETKIRVKNKYGWSEYSEVHFFTKDEDGVLSESSLLVEPRTTAMVVIPTANAGDFTTIFENSLGQQLMDILSSKDMMEEKLNELTNSHNIPRKIAKTDVDMLESAFNRTKSQFDDMDAVMNEMIKVFNTLTSAPSKENVKEILPESEIPTTPAPNKINVTLISGRGGKYARFV